MPPEQAPVLVTARLALRRFVIADADRLVLLCNDDAIARNTATIPRPYRREDALAFLGKRAAAGASEGVFAICLDGALIGCAGATAWKGEEGAFEIGYWIGADWRGRGYASEAARALVGYARETLGARAVVARRFADNPASGRVLEAAGLAPTGARFRDFSRGRGCEAETLAYRLDFA